MPNDNSSSWGISESNKIMLKKNRVEKASELQSALQKLRGEETRWDAKLDRWIKDLQEKEEQVTLWKLRLEEIEQEAIAEEKANNETLWALRLDEAEEAENDMNYTEPDEEDPCFDQQESGEAEKTEPDDVDEAFQEFLETGYVAENIQEYFETESAEDEIQEPETEFVDYFDGDLGKKYRGSGRFSRDDQESGYWEDRYYNDVMDRLERQNREAEKTAYGEFDSEDDFDPYDFVDEILGKKREKDYEDDDYDEDELSPEELKAWEREYYLVNGIDLGDNLEAEKESEDQT